MSFYQHIQVTRTTEKHYAVSVHQVQVASNLGHAAAEKLAAALRDAIEAGEVRFHVLDTVEPSPFAHEILNAKPYAFLDDAPLEERRTRAVSLRHVLPDEATDLAKNEVFIHEEDAMSEESGLPSVI